MARPVALFTLALPEPAPTLVAEVAEVRVLGRVPPTPELCAELRRGVDVLCPQLRDPVTSEVLDAGLPRLRAVCTYAVGFDNVDVSAATARGIAVGNTPGVLTDATADCTLALLLAAARRICEGDREVRAGGWTGWEPQHLLGLELRDSLLGIVGFGRIGQAVARRALAFGMRVAYAAAAAPPPIAPDLATAVTRASLDDLLTAADVLSLHVPLTPATRHLIDGAALRRMKPTAVLVNTSRGSVVDEAALVIALRERWIAAAGLDVYENEPALSPGLGELPNVVVAPHLGSATVRTRAAMAELVARNVRAALAGEPLPRWVNPDAWAAGPPAALVEAPA
ncbi:MAG TPA: D-glycerate dehydrogenase [Candidatus Dormibacteraeota bacterium]|nr:D-glycerate dehydrogenase [Candidatus Dormibacteraeota bacterium]